MEEIELEFEDVKRQIKLRLRGSPKVVDEYVEKFGGFSNLQKSFGVSPIEHSESEEISEKEKFILPMENLEVPAQPDAKTLSEYVEKLIVSTWGSKGRTSSEILHVAHEHGLSLPRTSLSGILASLNKQGKIRKSKGNSSSLLNYSPPISFVMKRREIK